MSIKIKRKFQLSTDDEQEEFCETIKKHDHSNKNTEEKVSSEVKEQTSDSDDDNDEIDPRNLNQLVDRQYGRKNVSLAPCSVSAIVTPFFTDIAQCFILSLEKFGPDVTICGMLYYFNDPFILQYLIDHKIRTHIIIQKQSKVWQRKNTRFQARGRNKWKVESKKKLREMYDQLVPYHKGRPAIECLGISTNNKITSPLMHQKSVIFIQNKQPMAVFTGSYNFTQNAKHSLESSMLIQCKSVAQEFWGEFMCLQNYSESLDWKSPSLARKNTSNFVV